MLISLFFKYFLRRKLRFFLFFFGILISLIISTSTVLIVKNIDSYYYNLDEIYRLDDFTLIAKNKWFNDSTLLKVKSVSGVIECEKAISVSSFIDKYPILIIGILKSPKVNTIPSMNWSVFNGYVAIIDSSLAEELRVKKGDVISILNHNFKVLDVKSIPWMPSYGFNFIGGIVVPYNILSEVIGVNGFNRIFVRVSDKGAIPSVLYDIKKSTGIDFNVEIRMYPIESILQSIQPIIDLAEILVVGMVSVLISAFISINLISMIKELGILISIGARKRNIIFSIIMTINIILLIASIFSLLISIFIVNYFWNTVVNFIEVSLSIPYNEILINYATYFLICDAVLVLISFSILKRNIVELIGRGEVFKSAPNIRIGNYLIKIPFAKICQRKWKSLLVLFSIIIALMFPVSFENVVYDVPSNAEKDLNDTFKADLIIVFYGYINYSVVNEIMPYIVSYETILYMSIPIYNITAKGKSLKPPYSYLVIFALQGNETLFSPNLVEGKLLEERIGISKKLSLILGVKIGDTVGIRTIHPILKTIINIQFVVSAIYDIGWWGGWVVFFKYDYLKKRLGVDKNAILVRTNNKEKIIEKLNKIGFNGFILSKNEVLKAIRKLYNTRVYPFIFFLDFLITNGSLLAIFVLTTYEINLSKREILILKALGASLKKISALFILEYFFLFIISLVLSFFITPIILQIITNTLNKSLLPLWIKTSFNAKILLLNSVKMTFLFALVYINVSIYYKRVTPKDFSE